MYVFCGQQLVNWIQKQVDDLQKVNMAMEATGHYWLALFSFLRKKGRPVQVINPIQSDAFRNLYICQTKNDTKDAFIIAEVLRFGRFSITLLARKNLIKLWQPRRFRFSLVDSIIAEHSHNRLGREKEEQVQSAAGSSFEIDYALECLSLSITFIA